MLTLAADAVEKTDEDPDIRVVVLTGVGRPVGHDRPDQMRLLRTMRHRENRA